MKLICTTSNPSRTNFNNTVICSKKWLTYKKTRNSDLKLYFFLITLSVSSIFYLYLLFICRRNIYKAKNWNIVLNLYI